jgi:hypothetical protein
VTAEAAERLDVVAAVTATRNGLTERQRDAFKELLLKLGVTCLHHGDAVGGDENCWAVAKRELGLRTEARPCNLSAQRAFTAPNDVTHEVLPPLVRNRKLAWAGAYLVGLPDAPEAKRPRSGTWATIRRGREREAQNLFLPSENRLLALYLIWPNGSVERDRPRGTRAYKKQ